MQILLACLRVFSIPALVILSACSSGGSDGSGGGTTTIDDDTSFIASPVFTSVVPGDGEIQLSWTQQLESSEGDDAGGPIVEYNLHYANATADEIGIADLLETTTTVDSIATASGYEIIEGINDTSYTVTGLDNLSLYYFILTVVAPEEDPEEENPVVALPSFEAYAMPRAEPIPYTLFQPLNDTGVTLCSDYSFGLDIHDVNNDGVISFAEINFDSVEDQSEGLGSNLVFESDNRIDCVAGDTDDDFDPIPTPEQQDYANGLDETANDDADGIAGFSFTKLDADGLVLPADASDSEVACIQDNNTQLIWEAKSSDQGSLHHSKDRFSWYNDDAQLNGESAGFAIPSTAAANEGQGNDICFGYDAADEATFCNTQAFIERVNDENLCGSSIEEWRLPTLSELRSLVNYGFENDDEKAIVPAVDTDFFPNTEVDGGLPDTTFDGGIRYWSSQTYAGGSSAAWSIYYGYGGTIILNKGTPNAVRLVRGAP